MTAPGPQTPSLSDVLPSAAAALGVEQPGRAVLELPSADRVVVVLVDGLGDELLRRVGSHAAFLNSIRAEPLRTGFPSTTATSMGSFGTGLPPGAHGLVGYEVLDPATDTVFNELSWEHGPDPRHWQPHPTVFEQLIAQGVHTAHVGPGYFAGSGLTTAALRGPEFVSAHSLTDRVEATIRAVRSHPRCLVYLYWGEVDRVGHERGVASDAWLAEVESTDLAIRTLLRRLPAGTLVVLTADHGMVDVPFAQRIDLADNTAVTRELRLGVRFFGGEPRAPMLYTEPGQADSVAERWRTVLAEDAEVLLGDDAVAAGWFGAVSDRVRPRIGDVVISMTGDRSVHDSRTQRPQLARLIGMHGARTDVETAIPLLVSQV